MATLKSTADFISEQMGTAGIVTTRKMFGEYALYLNGKVIGFICDDALYIKPTDEGKKIYPDYTSAPPYPGAKMYMLVDEGKWEDREFMANLATITHNALPEPKLRKKIYL